MGIKIKLLIILFIVFQNTSLFSNDDGVSNGFFVGGNLKTGALKDNLSIIAGARLAYLLEHRFALGVSLYNLVTKDIEIELEKFETPSKLSMDYFSMDAELFLNPEDAIIFSLKCSGGIASIKLLHSSADTADNNSESKDNAYIIEPEFAASLKLSSWSRIGGGLGYRKVVSLDLENPTRADMNNLQLNLFFMIGSF